MFYFFLISLSFFFLLTCYSCILEKEIKASLPPTFEFIHRQMGVKFIPLCIGISTLNPGIPWNLVHFCEPIHKGNTERSVICSALAFHCSWNYERNAIDCCCNYETSVSERSIETAIVEGMKSEEVTRRDEKRESSKCLIFRKFIIIKSFKSLKLWNVELYDTIIFFNLFKNVIYNKYFF